MFGLCSCPQIIIIIIIIIIIMATKMTTTTMIRNMTTIHINNINDHIK
jgi:Sec-independent protein translocase protein TatA